MKPWVPENTDLTKPPAKYALIDRDILEILKKSFLEHTFNNQYLNLGFQGKSMVSDENTWPVTLWDALDNIEVVEKNLLENSILYTLKRIKRFPFIYSKVKRIKNCWRNVVCTGFTLNTQGKDLDLIKDLINSDDFGKDSPLQHIYHSGQDCWRETACFGNPGLHVCIEPNVDVDIHTDFHQPTSFFKLNGYATYDVILGGLQKHLHDLYLQKCGQ